MPNKVDYRLESLLPHCPSLHSSTIKFLTKLVSISDYKAIGDLISSSNSLRELSINLHLSEGHSHGVELITMVLAQSELTTLETLEIAGCCFNETSANYVTNFLTKSTSIKYFHASDFYFPLLDQDHVLHHNSTLSKLFCLTVISQMLDQKPYLMPFFKTVP